jgi:gliding motility-associated-like protein
MCNNQLPYTAGINNTNVYSATICAGSPFSFNVNAFDADAGQIVTMTWNNGIPAATFAVTGSPLPTGVFSWTPTTADISTTPYCFTVTVSDDACPYSGSQTYAFCITVSGFSVGVTTTATNCGASNGTASALATGGTGPYSFNWQPSGGNNANANGLTAGTYTVYVTDAAGCVMSAVAVVPSGPANSNINATYSNINCFGGTQNIYLNVNGGQQPYTYSWSNNSTNQDLLNIGAGVYSVTVTTASGCTATATYTITQPSSPLSATANVISNVSCAGGNDGQAAVNAIGGSVPYSYSWNSTPAQTNAVATALNAGNYNVVVTDVNGCTTIQSASITEPLPLTVAASTSDVTCYGGSNGSGTVNASGGVGPYSVSWNTNPPQSGISAMNLQAGNYTATVTDANGCITGLNVNISEPPALNAIISSSTSVSCNGGNNGSATVQTAGGTAPYTYNWNTNPMQNNSAAVNMTAGSFTVTVTDANGCATISTVTITQPAPVTVVVSPSDTICPNSPFYITAIGSGGSGNFTYSWSPNIGSGNAYTVYASTQTTWTVSAIDANGCSSMPSTITADVYQFSPANLQITSTPAICAGSSAIITTVVNGNTGPLTWNWNNNLFGPGPHTVFPLVTTTYSVNVTNICGTVAPATTTVTVNPIPLINVPSQNASGCDEVSITFNDTVSANQNCFYFWDFGDNSTGTGNNPQHSYTASGTYTVSITATSPAGCVGNANSLVSLIVYDSPVANFTMSRTEASLIEPTIMFTDESSTNTIGWFWDFGDSTTSTAASPVHTYQREGTFDVRLVAVAIGGCYDTVTEPLEIIPEFTVFIPNAFTPNADGTNDVFYVYGEEITTFEMMIFDRWGNKIYESDDMNEGWDGRANGGSAIAQQDVYVYKVMLEDFEGKKHKFDGHVSLLK